MLILSLDCAGSGCGVCLLKDGQVLAQTYENMERGQDRRLIPLVMEIMQKDGADFAKLDRIAVTRGPGSFTGLRIGLAAARGIGLAADKPVIGIDRFAISRAQFPDKYLLAVIESRRAQLYVRYFQNNTADEPRMMTAAEIAAFLRDKPDAVVSGDAASHGIASFKAPSEAECITAATIAAKADPASPEYLPRPLYIRPPDVTFASA